MRLHRLLTCRHAPNSHACRCCQQRLCSSTTADTSSCNRACLRPAGSYSCASRRHAARDCARPPHQAPRQQRGADAAAEPADRGVHRSGAPHAAMRGPGGSRGASCTPPGGLRQGAHQSLWLCHLNIHRCRCGQLCFAADASSLCSGVWGRLAAGLSELLGCATRASGPAQRRFSAFLFPCAHHTCMMRIHVQPHICMLADLSHTHFDASRAVQGISTCLPLPATLCKIVLGACRCQRRRAWHAQHAGHRHEGLQGGVPWS